MTLRRKWDLYKANSSSHYNSSAQQHHRGKRYKKSGTMKCAITISIFLASFLSPSPARSEEGNLEIRFVEFEKRVNSLMTSQTNYLVTVYNQLAALEGKNEFKPKSATDNSSYNKTLEQSLTNALDNASNNKIMEHSMTSALDSSSNNKTMVHSSSNALDNNSNHKIMEQSLNNALDKSFNNMTMEHSLSLTNVLENLKNLSAKVELIDSALNNFQSVMKKVETLSSSFDLMASKVEGLANSLNKLQTDLEESKTVVEGMVVGTVGGAFTVSLPSLQTTRLAKGHTYPVAFDWTSRQVYWSDGSEGIKRANVDGTHAEVVLAVYSDSIAVDSISGNIYHGNVTSKEIKVCSSRGAEKCAVLAANQTGVDDIAFHSSRRLMFWTNETSIVKASMDGSNATVILTEKAWKLSIDEESDRLYWIDKDFEYIASMDLNGRNRRKLLNAATQVFAVAVQGDMVYYYDNKYNNVQAVGKHGGHPKVITKINAPVYDIAFYGSKNHFLENPCESSPCAHLCVPKLRSFTCLCPQVNQLDEDGISCV